MEETIIFPILVFDLQTKAGIVLFLGKSLLTIAFRFLRGNQVANREIIFLKSKLRYTGIPHDLITNFAATEMVSITIVFGHALQRSTSSIGDSAPRQRIIVNAAAAGNDKEQDKHPSNKPRLHEELSGGVSLLNLMEV